MIGWIVSLFLLTLLLVTESRNIRLRGALRAANLTNEVVAKALEETTTALKESRR